MVGDTLDKDVSEDKMPEFPLFESVYFFSVRVCASFLFSARANK